VRKDSGVQLPPYVQVASPRNARAATPVVSVVIPAYNESNRILPHLRDCASYFAEKKEPFEVLVVNDGSRDNTTDLVREEMGRFEGLGLVTYEKNRGKGHAVRVGMLAARGAWRLFTDADGSTPIAELERLRKACSDEGCPIAVGSRALTAPGIERKIKPHRYLIGQIFKTVRQVLLNVRVHDSQCGFKLFSAEVANKLYPVSRVDGFAFDVELLYLAALAGYQVAEVPVNWHDSEGTRVSFWRDPFKMVADMCRLRRLHAKTFKD